MVAVVALPDKAPVKVVAVTDVKPPNVVDVPPKLMAVVPIVMLLFANCPLVIAAVEDKLDVVNPLIAPPNVKLPLLVTVPLNVKPFTVPVPETLVTVPTVGVCHEIEPAVAPAVNTFPLFVVAVTGTCKYPSEVLCVIVPLDVIGPPVNAVPSVLTDVTVPTVELVPAPIAVLNDEADNADIVLFAFICKKLIALGFVNANKLVPTVVPPKLVNAAETVDAPVPPLVTANIDDNPAAVPVVF